MHPLRDRFRVVAVTGTDGKTTTTSIIAAIAEAGGQPALCVTTLGAFLGGDRIGDPATPGGFDRALAIALERGANVLALEVTSQALAHGFARTFPPDVAVMASFSRDHLDFHQSREHYLASKAQLFLALGTRGTAVLPAGEEAGTLIATLLPTSARVRTYVRAPASGPTSDLAPRAVRLDRRGLSISLEDGPLARALGGVLRLSLLSRVHVGNALAAALAADTLGLEAYAVLRGIAEFQTVPGRMELVAETPFVLVDFAHTPSALEGTLTSARELADGAALHVVFGCGGDRDRGKRAEMGAIAARLADRVLVTSDNPRSEDPALIAIAIEDGARAPGGRAHVARELDRELAIERAIEEASNGDVIVIAGRGHEHEQVGHGGVRRLLSDRDVAIRAVERSRTRRSA